jgi:hypothetical protein
VPAAILAKSLALTGLVLAQQAVRPATAPLSAEAEAFFRKSVLPVLEKRCLGCHGHAGKDGRPTAKGGLMLDARAGWEKGGGSGPAVVPGAPERSLLVKAIRHDDEETAMPPDEKLPSREIAILEEWVRRGAPDPRATSSAEPAAAAGRDFWAFAPLAQPTPPATRDAAWPASDLDRFILAELEARDLRPTIDASPAALARRLFQDLMGLPPSPAELAAFTADPSPERLAALVDELLARPQFGERWGRHWLDVARFSQSSGGGRPFIYPEAWRYRDWVIAAFNADMPFDRFVRLQLAGDLLPAATREERAAGLVATTYLALGPTNYERQDKDGLRMDVVDEQLDTIGRGILGLTLGCARCHDHKFDPIPIRDYYAMAGILRSTRTLIHDNVSRWIERPLPLDDATEAAVAAQEATEKTLEERLAILRNANKKGVANQKAKAEQVAVGGPAPRDAEIAQLEAELRLLRSTGTRRPRAMSIEEEATIEDSPLFIRGDHKSPGPIVPRGFLSVLAGATPLTIAGRDSGRRALADALVENPLAPRVLANRVWLWLMGAGLVRTPDNFGATGERPSHPALLDHLARRLATGGWSVKDLVREVVLSRTYRLATASPRGLRAADPENRLFGRATRRALDAEALRDAMLSVAGRLDLTIGGPNLPHDVESELTYRFSDTRRSVYTPVFRYRLHDLFEAFDFADPNLVQGRRPRTVTATQALFLLNSPFVAEQARAAAERLLAEERDPDARLQRAFVETLGRPPSTAERALLTRGLDVGDARTVWTNLFQSLFASLDFRFLR